MFRRFFLSAALIACFTSPTSAFAQSPGTGMDAIKTYLASIHTLHADFDQTNPDGTRSRGEIWLDRPGKIRIQYTPPAPFLIVANGNLLTFYDSQLGQTSNVPVNQTPLGILLQSPIDFSRLNVGRVQNDSQHLFVTLSRKENPRDGVITLQFTQQPVALQGWTIRDAGGNQTNVTLANVRMGESFSSNLFYFVDPNFFRNNGG